MTLIPELGPLALLVGTWEGDKGHDLALGGDRKDAISAYRERMVFTSIGRVDNHEQIMYGLRYHTTAWRLGAADSFHEDTGYWLWEPGQQQVMRCFVVPRGIAVIAGGTVAADARSFALRAELGSGTYGICSNPFLDREFKTVAFTMNVAVTEDTLTYDEDSVLEVRGRDGLFHHTDRNAMRRVA